MLPIKLDIPLVTLDVETTGVNPQTDRVIEIGIVKLTPEGEVKKWKTYVDPEETIPPESIAVHGITDEMVKGQPTFARLAPGLAKSLTMIDVCGYNVKFDLRCLKAEFKRASVPHNLDSARIIDVCKIFKMYHRRTLGASVRQYLGREMKGAHDALVDAEHTLLVLAAQLEQHTDLPKTIEELHTLLEETPTGSNFDAEGKLAWRNGELVLNFGPHGGTPLRQANRRFLRWILQKDFSMVVKRAVEDALEGKYRTRE